MGKKKEKYEKPVLRTIELVAEEVLGIGCQKKTGGSAVNQVCFLSQCLSAGTS